MTCTLIRTVERRRDAMDGADEGALSGGYFKPIEGSRDVDVQKTPGEDNKVDVKVSADDP